MIISGTSTQSALANMTGNMSGLHLRTKKSIEKMEGFGNQQKVRTVAFKRMVKQSSIDGTGMLVDIYA